MSGVEITIVAVLFLLWFIPGETAEGLFWTGLISAGAYHFVISPVLGLF